jgi:hypothetical protein
MDKCCSHAIALKVTFCQLLARKQVRTTLTDLRPAIESVSRRKFTSDDLRQIICCFPSIWELAFSVNSQNELEITVTLLDQTLMFKLHPSNHKCCSIGPLPTTIVLSLQKPKTIQLVESLELLLPKYDPTEMSKIIVPEMPYELRGLNREIYEEVYRKDVMLQRFTNKTISQ